MNQPEETTPEDSTMDITSDEFLQYKEMYLQTGSEPRERPSNSLYIEIEDYPEVGQTEKVRLVFNYGKEWGYELYDDPGDEFDIEYPIGYVHPPISMHLYATSEHVTLSNAKSNIHTDEPDKMEPYPLGETVKSTPVPNTQYVIEADLRVEKEGFHNIAGGVLYYFEELSGDNFKSNMADRAGQKTFASTLTESASLSEYREDGETFADHTIPVMGERGEPRPEPTPPPVIVDSEDQPKYSAEEFRHRLEGYIIDAHLKKSLSPEDILEELMNIQRTIPQMREFLANRMNYTDIVIEDLIATVPDDYYTHQNDTLHDPPLEGQGVTGQQHI